MLIQIRVLEEGQYYLSNQAGLSLESLAATKVQLFLNRAVLKWRRPAPKSPQFVAILSLIDLVHLIRICRYCSNV